MSGPQPQQGVPPQIDYSRARVIAANFCNLRHTNEEFVLDFGMTGADPGSTKNAIDTSVVISSYTAKRLWMSMGAIVASWEQSFGEIETEAGNRLVAQRPTPLGEPVPHVPIAPESRPAPPPTLTRSFRGPAQPPGRGPITIELPEGIVPFGSSPPPEPVEQGELNNSPCVPATGFTKGDN